MCRLLFLALGFATILIGNSCVGKNTNEEVYKVRLGFLKNDNERPVFVELEHFDSLENSIQTIKYLEDGTIWEVYNSLYDSGGRLQEYDVRGGKYKLYYSSTGKIRSKVFENQNGSQTFSYKYNKRGLLVSRIISSQDEFFLNSIEKYFYNNSDSIISIKQFSIPGNKPFSKDSIVFRGNKKIIYSFSGSNYDGIVPDELSILEYNRGKLVLIRSYKKSFNGLELYLNFVKRYRYKDELLIEIIEKGFPISSFCGVGDSRIKYRKSIFTTVADRKLINYSRFIDEVKFSEKDFDFPSKIYYPFNIN